MYKPKIKCIIKNTSKNQSKKYNIIITFNRDKKNTKNKIRKNQKFPSSFNTSFPFPSMMASINSRLRGILCSKKATSGGVLEVESYIGETHNLEELEAHTLPITLCPLRPQVGTRKTKEFFI